MRADRADSTVARRALITVVGHLQPTSPAFCGFDFVHLPGPRLSRITVAFGVFIVWAIRGLRRPNYPSHNCETWSPGCRVLLKVCQLCQCLNPLKTVAPYSLASLMLCCAMGFKAYSGGRCRLMYLYIYVTPVVFVTRTPPALACLEIWR